MPGQSVSLAYPNGTRRFNRSETTSEIEADRESPHARNSDGARVLAKLLINSPLSVKDLVLSYIGYYQRGTQARNACDLGKFECQI